MLHLKIFYLPLQTDTHSAQTELKHTLLVVYKSIVSNTKSTIMVRPFDVEQGKEESDS